MRTANEHVSAGLYNPLYEVIQGYEAFAAGTVQSISGLLTPNSRTLIVRLTEPVGDLPYRFSLPTSAPIPPHPFDGTLPLGVAQGHDAEYGRFLVSTGPYMFEGSEKVDFSRPPLEQVAPGGLEPGVSMVLVPNPSWDPAIDPLRERLADRIEVKFVLESGEAFSLLETGLVDLVLDATPPFNQSPDGESDEFQSFATSASQVTYVSMNLARAPFDDVHVRRAVNLVIDKAAVSGDLAAAGLPGRVAGHIVPDAVQGNLLLGFDPYATPDHEGNLAAAREEMALSRYDRDGNGVCEAPECGSIRATAQVRPLVSVGIPQGVASSIARDLRGIGLTLNFDRPFSPTGEPEQLGAITIGLRYPSSFPHPSAFFLPLLSGPAILGEYTWGLGRGAANLNTSLVGAPTERLEAWGYERTKVPSIDDRISQCLPLIGSAQLECWAYVDIYVTEKIVPWVPLSFGQTVRLGSSRLDGYTTDGFTALPALDRLTATEPSESSPGIARRPEQCHPSPIQPGRYTKTIAPQDLRPNLPADALPDTVSLISGNWTMLIGVADQNCIYQATYFNEREGVTFFRDIHPFAVPEPGVVELYGAREPIGLYRIEVTGDEVTYIEINDPSPYDLRMLVETTNPWIRQGQ